MILIIYITLTALFWVCVYFVVSALFDTQDTCRRIEAKLDAATKVKQ